MKIFSLVLVFSMLGSIFAYAHTDIYNIYKSAKVSYESDLSVTFFIEASTKNVDKKTTIYGEPYTLVAITSYREDFKEIRIEDVQLNVEGTGDSFGLESMFFVLEPFSKSKRNISTINVPLDEITYDNILLTGKFIAII